MQLLRVIAAQMARLGHLMWLGFIAYAMTLPLLVGWWKIFGNPDDEPVLLLAIYLAGIIPAGFILFSTLFGVQPDRIQNVYNSLGERIGEAIMGLFRLLSWLLALGFAVFAQIFVLGILWLGVRALIES